MTAKYRKVEKMRLMCLVFLTLTALSTMACDGDERAKILCRIGWCDGHRM